MEPVYLITAHCMQCGREITKYCSKCLCGADIKIDTDILQSVEKYKRIKQIYAGEACKDIIKKDGWNNCRNSKAKGLCGLCKIAEIGRVIKNKLQ